MLFLWKLRFFKSLIGLAKRPQETDEVFKLSDLLRKQASPAALRQLEEMLRANPELLALYESGDRSLLDAPYDLEALGSLPAETLGGQYARFMRRNRLSPEFFPYVEGDDILSFLQTRTRKTHDIWHVIAGFETDVPGELGLMGFYLSQLESKFPLAILAGGLLHLIGQTDVGAIKRTFDEIVRGYQSGKVAKKLYGLRFESLWERNLAELRAELGIVSSPGLTPEWTVSSQEVHELLAR